MSTVIYSSLTTGHLDSDLQVNIQGTETKSCQEDPLTSYSHWSPKFHLKAPQGWLNDPCGLGYDPSTGLYRVAFQWNPKGNDWGNVSWGFTISEDLVTWKISQSPYLVPTASYDTCGVFTGCLLATDIDGHAGALTTIYTSVSHLPIHYTLPYKRGCESLALAVSRDGVTWERPDCNPIIPGPPSDLDVVAWRDPFIGPLPSLSRITGCPSSQLYGFPSGGIKDRTPTVFVYTINSNNLRDWKYVGNLADVGRNFYPSRWSGDFGINWKVANIMTLSDDQDVTRDFVIVGTEGCIWFDDVGSQTYQRKAPEKRIPRQQLWMSIRTDEETNQADKSKPLAKYSFSGVFDHGCLYAVNSFFDPLAKQHVVFGWVIEEDLPDHLRHAQGWNGLISLPRVVEMLVIQNVTKARQSDLNSITSMEVQPNALGSFTIRTLAIKPDLRVKRLRNKADCAEIHDLRLCHPAQVSLQTLAWEITAEFPVNKNCSRVGLAVSHSPDATAQTILSWSPSTETFSITRPTPNEPQINHAPETAPQTLFTYSDINGDEREENLHVQAFFDGSVLEVFVNDRTVITTRIYCPLSDVSESLSLPRPDQKGRFRSTMNLELFCYRVECGMGLGPE